MLLHRRPGDEMRRSRHGIALVIVLLTIVALGILVAGAFFGSSQEVRIGREALRQEQTLAAAENALVGAIRGWDPDYAAALMPGELNELSVVQHGDITIRLTLLKANLIDYLLLADASTSPSSSGVSRRRIGMSLQLDIPDLRETAALEFHWPLEGSENAMLHDGMRISGVDQPPESWPECGPASTDIAGIMTADSTAVEPGCTAVGCVAGSPPVLGSPLAGVGGSGAFADATWSALVARTWFRLSGGGDIGSRDRPIRPELTDGRCDRLIQHNWGDPARLTDCASFFPTVHVLGDLVLDAGSGQGVLLVEGDLTLTGGVSYFGVVLVRGSLRSTDGGGRITGVVQVAGETGTSSLGPGTSITYSRCALLTALAASAGPRPISRSWVEMY